MTDRVAAIAKALLFRHILIGAENLVFTAGLGLLLLGLLKLLDLGRLVSPLGWVKLRRLALYVALFKGGLYTLCGSSFVPLPPYHVAVGMQIPDPTDLFILHGAPVSSPLHQTSASATVTLLLLGYAAVQLMVRLLGVRQSLRHAELLSVRLDEAGSERLRAIVQDTAAALGRAKLGETRVCVVGEGSLSSGLALPLTIGYSRPQIVIDTWWLSLSESRPDLLRAALRHEMMHIAHGHHRTRWWLLWLRDLAWLTGLGTLAMREIVSADELQCDRESSPNLSSVKALAETIAAAGRRDDELQSLYDAPALTFGYSRLQFAAIDETAARLSGFGWRRGALKTLQERRLESLLSQASRLAAGTRVIGQDRRTLASKLGRAASVLASIAACAIISALLLIVAALRVYVHPA